MSATDNTVIHLPRPRAARGEARGFGFFVRIGRNDHKNMMDIIAGGERGLFGAVIDANNARRHRELIALLRDRGFDVALDPKTQPMGMVGGHNQGLSELPWALERPHRVDDFSGDAGRTRADQIATFAAEHRFTQVLGPTHLLQSANDPWLRRDIFMMGELRRALDASGRYVDLIYSLALPMQVMRDRQQRGAILAAVADAPMDGLWLKVEHFGSDATGEKTATYVEACQDFHALNVPLVADHVGGLPGLGLLAFGAVGGLAHGVTLLEGFKVDRWRRPPTGKKGRTPDTRVYIPQLDLMLKPGEADAFLNASPRLRSRFGCKDTHCCPQGMRDMLGQPARHFIHQRGQEIASLAAVPEALRVREYLDQRVRRASDDIAAAAGFDAVKGDLHDRLVKKQRASGRFRDVIAHLAEAGPVKSFALAPIRRAGGDGR